jgi:hypothetical protein
MSGYGSAHEYLHRPPCFTLREVILTKAEVYEVLQTYTYLHNAVISHINLFCTCFAEYSG